MAVEKCQLYGKAKLMLTVYAFNDPFQVNPASARDQNGVVRTMPNGSSVGLWLSSYDFNGNFIVENIGIRFLDGFTPTGGSDVTLPISAAGVTGNVDFQVLQSGRLLLSWQSGPQTGEYFGILQLVNADGSLFGSEIDLGQSSEIRTEELEWGGFVAANVVYDVKNSGNQNDVWAHFFDGTGQPMSGAVRLNATRVGTQDQVAVSDLGGSELVAVWRDDSQNSTDNDGRAIFGRVFNLDGTAATKEFLVNSTYTGDQNDCAVTDLANGDFVVTWRSVDRALGVTGVSSICARVFHPTGMALGLEFVIDTAQPSQGFAMWLSPPQVTSLPDGRFVVVWTVTSSDLLGVQTDEARLQVFDANGAAASVIYGIGDFDASVLNPTVETLTDGRIAVSWTQGDTSGQPDLFCQILDSRDSGIHLDGNNFDNQYFGTTFADALRGADGDDTLDGSSGNDRLGGDKGKDILIGGSGRDRLLGKQGDDSLYGGSGADTLNGGTGTDLLIGGSGSDRFIFKPGDGADVIRGFTNGVDLIDLVQFNFTSFRDAASHFVAHQGGAEFQMGADTILVFGLDFADLTKGDLIL